MHISNVRISKPNIPQQLQSVADAYHYPIPRITIARDGRKILFVLDRTAKESLDGWQGPRYAGVFHPEHEIVVSNILNHVMKQGDYKVKECLFLNYPTFYVADKHLYAKHRHLFAERLTEIIGKYKPDCVVFCGVPSYVDFIKYTTTQQNTRYIKGHVSRVWDWQHKEHPEIKCQMVGTVSLHQIASQQSDEMAVFPNLIGYFCASVIRAFTGVNEYTIDVADSKFIYVDTIEKFDRFLPKLLEAQIVAIDTEGRSLARTVNEVYSIQFAFDGHKAYFVPLYHPKTPFTDKELEYVSAKLRHYFETGSTAKYHIYHNANFDITVLKIPVKSLGVRHYKTRIFDTIAGEFAIGENRKFLSKAGISEKGQGPYSLDFITTQYGCDIYYKLKFSKADRGNMVTTELDAKLIAYACYDVIVIFQMAELQRKEAKRQGQTQFMQLMLYQFDHMIKAFSTAEYNGVLIDKKHLAYLMGKESPIRALRAQVEIDMRKDPEYQKADLLVKKADNIPTGGGLFGKRPWYFNIKKAAHKACLFFGVLGLTPLSMNKSGTAGKIDKKLQEQYKDIPAVALYTQYSKLSTLLNTFIGDRKKGIYGISIRDPDTRKDGRLRPRFDFKDVVTGRTSSHDPNLQNISQHDKLAKHLKRMFLAALGNLLIELDYSAHEVRCWANISGDKDLANAFKEGMFARFRYRLKPSTALYAEVADKGDIHKLNHKHFYGRFPKDKAERNGVKAVVFGTIYGLGAKALALTLKITEEQAQALIDLLFVKFKNGGKFLIRTMARAKRTCLAISPIGRFRHLWGYLHNRVSVINAMNRRAPNSIVQGLASDILQYAATEFTDMVWHYFVKHGVPMFGNHPGHPLGPNNYVHDSVKGDVPVILIPIYMYLAEHACTTRVHRAYRRIFGHKMLVGVEIDFTIGATADNMYDGWDWNCFSKDVYKTVTDKEGTETQERVPCLVEIIESKLADAAKLYPEYWTEQQIRATLSVFTHNLKITHAIRMGEIRETLRTKKAVSEVCHMNEQNARSFGLIFDAGEMPPVSPITINPNLRKIA